LNLKFCYLSFEQV
jgi:hypothetical protein